MELNNINLSRTKKDYIGCLYQTSKVTVQVVKLIDIDTKPELVEKKIYDYTINQLEKENLITKLKHENIVKYERIYKSEKHKKILIYMEYLKKGSLRNIMENLHFKKDKKKDQSQLELFAGVIGYEILKGLHYMEKEKNIFHRDLKPENICIGKLGEIKLVDFGSCTELTDYYCDTEVGTRCYMAPEIYINGKYKPGKSDVWSLGIMLYEFVFGKHPFLKREELGNETLIEEKYNSHCKNNYKLDFECCIPQFKIFIRNMLNFDYKNRKSFNYFINKKDSFLKNRIMNNTFLKKDFIEFLQDFENQKLT